MIAKILRELAADNSRHSKEAILTREQNNVQLKRVIVAALDPTISYYIKKIPQYTRNPSENGNLTWALSKLLNFSERTLTGTAAIDSLRYVLSCLEEDDAKVIERVIERDLRCGVSASTVNKIWPGLIPTFPYMRCSLPSGIDTKTWDWKNGVFSQLKADGMFVNVSHDDNGDVKIFSRHGSVFPQTEFKDLVSDIKENFKRKTQTNGELLVYENNAPLERELSNGILNSIQQGGTLENDNQKIVYLVWDQIPLTLAVPKGECKVEYIHRYNNLLNQTVSAKFVKMIPTKFVYSFDEAMEHYMEFVEAGFEGSIIKTKTGFWKDSTSKDQVKMKVECDIDLEIIGFNPGKGKNADTFGSVICASSDRKMIVNVSGFSDKERKEINNNRDKYLSKIVTVRINSIMKSRHEEDSYSSFLPRKVEIRFDKDVADDMKRIFEQFDSVIKGK